MDRTIDLTCIVCNDEQYLEIASRFYDINQFFNHITTFQNPEKALEFFKNVLEQQAEPPANILLDLCIHIDKVPEFMDAFCEIENISGSPVNIYLVQSGINRVEVERLREYNSRSPFNLMAVSLKEVQGLVTELP
ncbi:hypothetical protein [Robertkochia aurantiaca]|uniref:hypothetical protein n=1 Tax=Robertkochia aurantiaca TaxID=2873700 RepID=UPI001CC912B8|nr:hypothetical protein [Robertkochia sp. 3YJGBD-33]